MNIIKTVSFVFPFRNRSILAFRNTLTSLKWQTIRPNEVVIVDMSTEKSKEMVQLCEDFKDCFNINYTYLHVVGDEKWMD